MWPIAVCEMDALRRFSSRVRGPVNVVCRPHVPSLAELAALGVARLSWGPEAMVRFEDQLAWLRE